MSLDDIFRAFTHGNPEMDSRSFLKVLKDAKIIDKTYTQTDADLLFTKIKKDGKRGSTKINFTEFKKAMDEIAKKKKTTPDEVIATVVASGGPKFTGTKTEDVRFYDDKSLYTGVHAHGGPTTVDAGRTGVSDLSQITNRQSATIRGTDAKIDVATKKS